MSLLIESSIGELIWAEAPGTTSGRDTRVPALGAVASAPKRVVLKVVPRRGDELGPPQAGRRLLKTEVRRPYRVGPPGPRRGGRRPRLEDRIHKPRHRQRPRLSSAVVCGLRESRSCDYQSDKRAPTNASDSPRIARSTIRTARATRWRCKSRPGPIPIATRCACSHPSRRTDGHAPPGWSGPRSPTGTRPWR